MNAHYANREKLVRNSLGGSGKQGKHFNSYLNRDQRMTGCDQTDLICDVLPTNKSTEAQTHLTP